MEQERLVCEQKLGPLRERIGEVKLKEQEARLTVEQYAQQLAEAGAKDEELAALLEREQPGRTARQGQAGQVTRTWQGETTPIPPSL